MDASVKAMGTLLMQMNREERAEALALLSQPTPASYRFDDVSLARTARQCGVRPSSEVIARMRRAGMKLTNR